MRVLALIFTSLVALIHVGIMIVEMFFWNHPVGMGMFNTSETFAAQAEFMAVNQGLYNGFLVAGLVWGMLAKKRDVVVFFLACVFVAGILGALTVKPTVFFVQSVPALIALAFTFATKPKLTDA